MARVGADGSGIVKKGTVRSVDKWAGARDSPRSIHRVQSVSLDRGSGLAFDGIGEAPISLVGFGRIYPDILCNGGRIEWSVWLRYPCDRRKADDLRFAPQSHRPVASLRMTVWRRGRVF